MFNRPPKQENRVLNLCLSNLCTLCPNGDLARRLLAGKDILGGGEDGGPVLESGVGHAAALAESHKI